MGHECMTLCPSWMGAGMILARSYTRRGAVQCLGLAPPYDPTDHLKKKTLTALAHPAHMATSGHTRPHPVPKRDREPGTERNLQMIVGWLVGWS